MLQFLILLPVCKWHKCVQKFFHSKECKLVDFHEERSFFHREVDHNASSRNALNANENPQLGCIRAQISTACTTQLLLPLMWVLKTETDTS